MDNRINSWEAIMAFEIREALNQSAKFIPAEDGKLNISAIDIQEKRAKLAGTLGDFKQITINYKKNGEIIAGEIGDELIEKNPDYFVGSDIPDYIKSLNNPYDAIRTAAFRKLVQEGGRAVPYLINLLKDKSKNTDYRATAVSLLGEISLLKEYEGHIKNYNALSKIYLA